MSQETFRVTHDEVLTGLINAVGTVLAVILTDLQKNKNVSADVVRTLLAAPNVMERLPAFKANTDAGQLTIQLVRGLVGVATATNDTPPRWIPTVIKGGKD